MDRHADDIGAGLHGGVHVRGAGEPAAADDGQVAHGADLADGAGDVHELGVGERKAASIGGDQVNAALAEMLNKGVTPYVCQKGSVGACGDLSPMSQIALLMMGEGEAFLQGVRMPGGAALEAAGIAVHAKITHPEAVKLISKRHAG